MKDIFERYFKRLLLFYGSEEEYGNLLMEALKAARDYGIRKNIAFFMRMNRRKKGKERSLTSKRFKEERAEIDDIRAANERWWKDYNAYYNYWNKHVTRR